MNATYKGDCAKEETRVAKLSFRYGAMNAGKSTMLLQVAYNFEENGRKVLVIKPAIDIKGKDQLVTRIGLTRKVDIVLENDESLYQENLYHKWRKVDAILVDEAQFMNGNQVEELWRISKENNIPVICYGLRADFASHAFPGSARLFELADEFTELVTICQCGKKARFNARKVDGKYTNVGEQNIIDGSVVSVVYQPLCGECYLKFVVKQRTA